MARGRSLGTLHAAAKWVKLRGEEVRASEYDVPGMERFPMNLIEGTRSAWATACRNARVANMVAVLYIGYVVFLGLESGLYVRCAGQSLLKWVIDIDKERKSRCKFRDGESKSDDDSNKGNRKGRRRRVGWWRGWDGGGLGKADADG